MHPENAAHMLLWSSCGAMPLEVSENGTNVARLGLLLLQDHVVNLEGVGDDEPQLAGC